MSPITELALLHILAPTTPTTPTLLTHLSHAKTVMETYTGRKFHYLQQIEDPSYVYIVGEWDSLEQHLNQFIPSEGNQKVLRDLEGLVEVELLVHVGVSHAELPLPEVKADGEGEGEFVVGIVRHFVKDGKKEEFERTFEENKGFLRDFVTEGRIGGGWRVDPEVQGQGKKEEFVLWCPWKDVEQHQDFAGTEGFVKYGRIRESIEGAEIKHARVFSV